MLPQRPSPSKLGQLKAGIPGRVTLAGLGGFGKSSFGPARKPLALGNTLG
jgi:hypothetical protein